MFSQVSTVGAAVGEHQPGWSLLALIAGAVAVAYLVDCLWFPNRRCQLCRGEGKLWSPVSRSWRQCRCDKGETVRWGRRVFGGAFRQR